MRLFRRVKVRGLGVLLAVAIFLLLAVAKRVDRLDDCGVPEISSSLSGTSIGLSLFRLSVSSPLVESLL